MEIRHDEYNMINDNTPGSPVAKLYWPSRQPNTGKVPIQLSDWIKQHTGNWLKL